MYPCTSLSVTVELTISFCSQYISQSYPMEVNRVSQLCEVLDLVRAVPGHVIEELFFRATIGAISIEKIISDMYRSNKEIV